MTRCVTHIVRDLGYQCVSSKMVYIYLCCKQLPHGHMLDVHGTGAGDHCAVCEEAVIVILGPGSVTQRQL